MGGSKKLLRKFFLPETPLLKRGYWSKIINNWLQMNIQGWIFCAHCIMYPTHKIEFQPDLFPEILPEF